MKVTTITSIRYKDKFSSMATIQSWPIWRFPVPLVMLMCPLLLGTPQARAQAGSVAPSIWNNATVPSVPSAADSNASELGLKFKSAVDGNITGIRFYKGSSNTGSHVGNLWTSSGTLLGSVTFANETASGWQQQALPSPVPISANTTYVVSYFAPAGGYAVDLGYFATSGVDNYPLRALEDGEDGPNGVYAYSAVSVFPTQTYDSANYWVDVVFAESQVDTNPPTITCPGDVILQCASCNTDPSNTGTATATDDSGSVSVTYNDSVSGTCPQVVKRTWIATDPSGNVASCVQTITCLPPSLVTDGSGCVFDSDPTTPVQDFSLLFMPVSAQTAVLYTQRQRPGRVLL